MERTAMENLVLLKLIFRNWWRNKLFAVISLVSLVVGISCTNLLISFVIHEYTIEGENPKKDRILRLTQRLPSMQSTGQVSFVYGGSVAGMIAPFPEIESYLRLTEKEATHIEIENQRFPQQVIVEADSSFCRFFPYQILSGNMKEALTKPDCIALSEEKAMQYFGKFDCIGRELSVVYGDKVEMKKVSAIYKFYAQSALRIDLLGNSQNLQEEGTSCMILLKEKTDVSAFCERFESTELPTVTGPGYYKLQTLQESYFDTKLADSVKTFSHRQIALLSIGLLSAFLVLFIACFNYVNLSFSRLLKQVNMIHVETLMGASHSYICRQLFIDTFLTVFIAFILSILVMGDILSLFNYFFDARLTFGFILSWKVFPFILLFVSLLAIIPATYMTKKLNRISISGYRQFFQGRKRRRLVATLVGVQMVISIGLMTAFMMIRTQLSTIEEQGERFKGILILGNEGTALTVPLYNDIKNLPGIQTALLSKGRITSPFNIIIPLNRNGQEVMVNKVLLTENYELLDLFNIELLEPERTKDLFSKVAHSVVVNEAFVQFFVPAGEDPVGQALSKYAQDNAGEGTIIGVCKDFRLTSFNSAITPMQIILQEIPVDQATYLSCRIDESRRNEIVKNLRLLWEKHEPGHSFCLHRRLSAIYIQQYRYGEFLPIITGLCYNQFVPDPFWYLWNYMVCGRTTKKRNCDS
ncbi:ABC transporter permease [Bacteroides thetaiotaomicron]|nr:ABC transporter permease [Bacteroides thetaiotaomicron]